MNAVGLFEAKGVGRSRKPEMCLLLGQPGGVPAASEEGDYSRSPARRQPRQLTDHLPALQAASPSSLESGHEPIELVPRWITGSGTPLSPPTRTAPGARRTWWRCRAGRGLNSRRAPEYEAAILSPMGDQRTGGPALIGVHVIVFAIVGLVTGLFMGVVEGPFVTAVVFCTVAGAIMGFLSGMIVTFRNR